jgi:outer membrane protein TolC
MKKTAIFWAFWMLAGQAFGQVLSAGQAVQAALQHHPQARAAVLDAESKRIGERAAHALPNPELNAESPTGAFYTVGVLQSFEFPTVYKNRKKMAQAETQLAAAGVQLTENELRYAVRMQYLELQAADFQMELARRRDTVFQKIGEAAARQFAAGEIDFLQKTLAENEASAARQHFLATQNIAENLRMQLEIWTGITNVGKVEPLRADLLDVQVADENPAVLYEKQAAALARQQIDLTRSQMLPGFSFGYLNQGARQSPVDYRFRASVEVPIWFGQSRAARQSAEVAALAAESRATAAAQNVALELSATLTEAANARTQVGYFESEGLPRSRSLADTAMRMHAAGQIDYPTFLRTLDIAFSIENDYVAQLKTLHAAQIKLQFLAGN